MTREQHILRLIEKAMDDVHNGRKGNAIGKLAAAKGNVILLASELKEHQSRNAG